MSGGEIASGVQEKLQAQGWYVRPEGLSIVTQNGSIKDFKAVLQNALDTDLKEIGKAVLSDLLSKRSIENVVVQIQKVRNLSAPKANEDSQAAPRMLKLIVTDGHTHCQAIEYETIGGISLHKTAPGSKILLKSAKITSGYIFLNSASCLYLGGKVPSLYEKWEVNKNMSNYKRGDGDSDGPPPWVNFGIKIAGFESKDFKSLEVKKEEKQTEFDMQRKDAIAEAASGAVKKVFGGGTKTIPSAYEMKMQGGYNARPLNRPESAREPRNGRKNKKELRGEKGDEKPQKPSENVSLFSFLADKLPVSQNEPVQYQPEPAKPKYTNNPKYGSKPAGFANNSYGKPKPHHDFNRPQSDYSRPQSDYSRPQNDYSKPHSDYHNRPQNDYNNRPQNDYNRSLDYNRAQNDYKPQNDYNRPQNDYNRPQNDYNRPQNDYNNKPQNDYSANKFNEKAAARNERAPRFKPKEEGDSLANNMDRLNINASFASKAFKQHLNLPNSSRKENNFYSQNDKPKEDNKSDLFFKKRSSDDFGGPKSEWNWHVGDQCLAKYWEDNKFYNASITGLTNRTCVVQFNDYGNMEEVLKTDCLPITDTNHEIHLFNNKEKVHSGSFEFRQGGNRNYFNKTYKKPYQERKD